jgi:hypothetical protein
MSWAIAFSNSAKVRILEQEKSDLQRQLAEVTAERDALAERLRLADLLINRERSKTK